MTAFPTLNGWLGSAIPRLRKNVWPKIDRHHALVIERMIMARSEQSKRAREIFEGALDIVSLEERTTYVKDACGGNDGLRQRVEALLRANDLADSFLPNEPKENAAIALSEEKLGTVIGRYKLLQKIG